MTSAFNPNGFAVDESRTRHFFYRAYVMSRTAVTNFLFAGIVPVVIFVGFSTASTVSAQGLDDLFQRPTDSRFATPADDEPFGPLRALQGDQRAEKSVSRIPGTELNQGQRRAAEQGLSLPSRQTPIQSPSDLKLVDEAGSSSIRQQPRSMAMEIRQARALAQMKARIARLEAARWTGNPTLRPSWNPDPTTGSRYPVHNVARVPIYIRGR